MFFDNAADMRCVSCYECFRFNDGFPEVIVNFIAQWL